MNTQDRKLLAVIKDLQAELDDLKMQLEATNKDRYALQMQLFKAREPVANRWAKLQGTIRALKGEVKSLRRELSLAQKLDKRT